MKKYWKELVLIVLLGLGAHEAYSMDALEQAYQEQFVAINKDIAHSEELKHMYIQQSIKWMEFSTREIQNGDERGAKDSDIRIGKATDDANRESEKITALESKRQELKIKVLEKYNTLPKWWIEPNSSQ